ncbi:MAG: trimeric autotransporter adhesin [Campylobacterota bacterium]|nr:trimeric autotransporter adhesin [Campylobacterota bacterium]
MRRTFWLLLIAGFINSLYAQVGHVIEVVGDVKIFRFDSETNTTKEYAVLLKKDENQTTIPYEILKNDKLKTLANARAKINLIDDTVVTIGKNSEFLVNEFFYEQNNTASKAQLNFAQGAFRSASGKIAKIVPQNFKLKTKTATIGIRGTEILGMVGENEDKIACTKGELAVSSLDEKGEVSVKAGQITKVKKDETPEPAREYTLDELQEFLDSAGEADEEIRKALGVAPFVNSSENNETNSSIKLERLESPKAPQEEVRQKKLLEKIFKF